MKLINLTPHTITLLGHEYPSEGCARVSVTKTEIAKIGGVIPINKSTFGDVTGLPEAEHGTGYIVSRIVAEAAKDRPDLYIVDETVRDDQGRIIGCNALAQI